MDWRADILQIVDRLRPPSLLALMPEREPLRRELARRVPGPACTFVCADQLLSEDFTVERSRLAIVAGVIERLNKRKAGKAIARLRDLYAQVMYALVPVGDTWPGLASHWTNEELIAYGLRQARQYTVEGRALILYHYDIYDYKLTPDWLNSRYWANPERWEKQRW
ncbi:MAG: DUF6231 family protein [Gammaproteobacteria bacterium]